MVKNYENLFSSSSVLGKTINCSILFVINDHIWYYIWDPTYGETFQDFCFFKKIEIPNFFEIVQQALDLLSVRNDNLKPQRCYNQYTSLNFSLLWLTPDLPRRKGSNSVSILKRGYPWLHEFNCVVLSLFLNNVISVSKILSPDQLN